tara:strand:- start:2013 stop:4790 length:2778 start_codon:yes stop_codon:yes gene_type:complete
MIKKISYSFVIADLFHYGHLRVLEKAKKMSDYHICGVLSDKVCSEWQGENLCNLDERIKVLKSCIYIDEIMTQSSMNPEENLKKILKKYRNCSITVFHGDDWKILPGQIFMDNQNIKTKLVSHYKKLSRDSIHNHFSKLNSNFNNNTYNYEFNNYKNLFETKGQTLITLNKYLKKSIIEEIYTFKVRDYFKNKNMIIKQIKHKFKKKIIVRSSTKKEDSLNSSHAGEFLTVQNVHTNDDTQIIKSINKVIKTYKEKMKSYMDEEILIQKQSSNIKLSGVVFTRGLNTNSPYYVVTYDDQSGKTDTVTGGETCSTIWLYRDLKKYKCPSKWKKLLTSIIEIEKLFKSMVLDIEFAINKNNKIIIYQVRPLATNIKYRTSISENFILNSIEKYTDLCKQNINILSDMTFWNPSELIGENPKPLSYSLFNDIFMKKNWNKGLADLGYTKVEKNLMHKIGNKPYIDVKSVIRALLPDNLNKDLKAKLEIFYQKRFLNHSINHDKFEFYIMSGSIILDKKLSRDLEIFLTKTEYDCYVDKLNKITNNIINSYKKHSISYKKDLKKCIINKKIDIKNNHISIIKSIKDSLDSLKKYATAQFSGSARMAFISKYILDCSVTDNYLEKNDLMYFYNSLNTIVSKYTLDMNKLSVNQINKKYGHLRSGTYSLLSPKFKILNKPELYKKDVKNIFNKRDFLIKLKVLLKEYNLKCKPNELYSFLSDSIKLREDLKFNFTKTISRTLDLIISLAKYLNIDLKDMEYLDIEIILAGKSYSNKVDCSNMYKTHITSQKNLFDNNNQHIHSACITSLNDLFIIEHPISKPNFITEGTAKGRIQRIDKTSDTSMNLTNRIILIDSADPGFDWIFTSKIKGLITKYGGMGSHMAIRCAELNIPAAIGCGHRIFENLSSHTSLALDCAAGEISSNSKYEIFN